jgi:hypothetical protein
LVLEACKPILLTGRKDRIPVRPCHLETAGHALFVPPFVPHAADGPAGLIGIRKLGKGSEMHCQLHGDGKTRKEVLDGVVMGRRAEFSLHNAHDCAVMDGGIELLDIQDMRRNGFRRDMALPPRVAETVIHQAQQAFHGKAAGLRPHDGRLDPRLTTAFSNGVGKEHDRPHHFVIVLNVVDNAPLVLRKILHSRHALPPSRDRNRRTTAAVHMVAERPLAGRWCGGNYYILQK